MSTGTDLVAYIHCVSQGQHHPGNLNGLPLASITVIELKRPCRNDAAQGEEKDPIEQALMYLDRVRKGTVRIDVLQPGEVLVPVQTYTSKGIIPSDPIQIQSAILR